MKESTVLAVVVSFAAGVLVTGVAYDFRDLEAANERKAAAARAKPVPESGPGQRVRELMCAHRVATGRNPGKGCV